MNVQIEFYTVLLECLLAAYFFHKMLRPDYPSRTGLLRIYLVYFVLLLFTTFYAPIFLRLGVVCLFLFLCYHFYLKQSAIKTAYTLVLFFVAAMFADLIGGFILSRLGMPVDEILGTSVGRFIYNTSAKLIHLLLLAILLSVTLLHYDSHALLHAIPLILCNAVSIFILSVQFDSFIISNQYAPFVLSTTGMLLINIVICCYTESVKHTYELREKELCMEEQLKCQEKYYQDMVANQKESHALWHDMKKYMLAMENLVTDNRSAEADVQLSFLKKKFDDINHIVNTGNPMVDGILSYGMQKARDAGIPMKLNLWLNPSLEFSPVDFYIIVGNTIDNAVEACSVIPDSESPSVTCILRQKNHILFYEISNPIPDNIVEKPGRIHGYGLENVKKCVQRNKGSISISKENGIFCVSVTLNVQETDTGLASPAVHKL